MAPSRSATSAIGAAGRRRRRCATAGLPKTAPCRAWQVEAGNAAFSMMLGLKGLPHGRSLS
eukprot:1898076-Lingulodinium_polyedra.AAC.1